MAGIARILGVLLAAVAIAAGPALPATAGSRGGVPPPDVQRVFDQDAIPFIRESSEGLDGAPSVYQDVDGVDNISELFMFTPGYLHGTPIGQAYQPTGEWIATLTAGFVAVGTVRVRTADGVDPYVSQWNGDAELGGKLADAAGVDVIEDEPAGAFYAVFGQTIGPLNEGAVVQLPTPTTLAEYQKVLMGRLGSDRVDDAADPLEPGGILAIVAVVAGLGAGAGLLLSARVRARRSATG